MTRPVALGAAPPTAEEVRNAIHRWQAQDQGTEESEDAAVKMADLLRRLLPVAVVLCPMCRLRAEAYAAAYMPRSEA